MPAPEVIPLKISLNQFFTINILQGLQIFDFEKNLTLQLFDIEKSSYDVKNYAQSFNMIKIQHIGQNRDIFLIIGIFKYYAVNMP